MKKILLVDDEESIHILYREELEDQGFEVHSAMSGEDALKILRIRLTDEEMEKIIPDQYVRIRRQELIKYASKLG